MTEMKTQTLKSGTRAEIIEYLRSLGIKTITLTCEGFGCPSRWSEYPNEGDLFEFSRNTIENQIDRCIDSGNPIVAVSILKMNGNEYQDTFIVTDFGDVRVDRMMTRLDDLELRERKIESIKLVLQMDIDAEERWDRILKIIDSYNGVEFTNT